jgi:hypothetical protein
MEEQEALDYLNTTVRDMIIDDVIRVADFQCDQNKGRNEGYFGIPRQVFCIVDFLGHLLNPPRKNYKYDTSLRAIKFIQTCFPESYRDIAPLIYQQWRHGTVHALLPKKYIVKVDGQEIRLRWLSSRSKSEESRNAHMLPMYQKERRDDMTIVVNIVELAKDLLKALDNFIGRIEGDDKLRKECIQRFSELLEYQTPNDKYKDIIISVWKNPRGVLDGKNVVEIFEND